MGTIGNGNVFGPRWLNVFTMHNWRVGNGVGSTTTIGTACNAGDMFVPPSDGQRGAGAYIQELHGAGLDDLFREDVPLRAAKGNDDDSKKPIKKEEGHPRSAEELLEWLKRLVGEDAQFSSYTDNDIVGLVSDLKPEELYDLYRIAFGEVGEPSASQAARTLFERLETVGPLEGLSPAIQSEGRWAALHHFPLSENLLFRLSDGPFADDDDLISYDRDAGGGLVQEVDELIDGCLCAIRNKEKQPGEYFAATLFLPNLIAADSDEQPWRRVPPTRIELAAQRMARELREKAAIMAGSEEADDNIGQDIIALADSYRRLSQWFKSYNETALVNGMAESNNPFVRVFGRRVLGHPEE